MSRGVSESPLGFEITIVDCMYVIAAILRILVLYFLFTCVPYRLTASKSITEYQTTFIYKFRYKLSVRACQQSL